MDAYELDKTVNEQLEVEKERKKETSNLVAYLEANPIVGEQSLALVEEDRELHFSSPLPPALGLHPAGSSHA